MLNFNAPKETEPTRKRPGRRPTLGPKRVKNILIKMTPAEKDAVWAAARQYDMTLSDFVRNCITDIRENGFTVPVRK